MYSVSDCPLLYHYSWSLLVCGTLQYCRPLPQPRRVPRSKENAQPPRTPVGP